jgi:repressor LexA
LRFKKLDSFLNTAQMSSIVALSKKQEAVRRYVADELAAGRICPSHRDIAAHFGFSSSYAAACHVRALIKKGVLIGEPGKARSLRLAVDYKPIGQPELANIPVFGSVPAGFAENKQQEADEHITVDAATIGFKPTKNTFGLRVTGDSMIERHICDGDTVVLEQGPTPRAGQIVAALIDGKSTLKTFAVESGKPILRAENPKHKNQNPFEELVIQGVFRALIRKGNK